jgi:hypothetical protein
MQYNLYLRRDNFHYDEEYNERASSAKVLSGGALSGIRTDKTHYSEALVVESERP